MTQTSMEGSQYKEWTGTPCRPTPTIHPISAVWCLGRSSLCPHSGARFTQPSSKQYATGLVCSSSPEWNLIFQAKQLWWLKLLLQASYFIFMCRTSPLSRSICPSDRRGSHTAVCQKWHQTETSKQLSYPLPRTQTCFLRETPRKHNGWQNAVLNRNSKSHWHHPQCLQIGSSPLKQFLVWVFWELGLGFFGGWRGCVCLFCCFVFLFFFKPPARKILWACSEIH